MAARPIHVVELPKKIHLADFGCGKNPRHLFKMAKENPGAVYFGADKRLSAKALKKAKRYKNLYLFKENIEDAASYIKKGSLHNAKEAYVTNNMCIPEASGFLEVIRDKLAPRGVLSMTNHKGKEETIRRLLTSEGYKIEKVTPIEELDTMRTPDTIWWLRVRDYARKINAGKRPPLIGILRPATLEKALEFSTNPEAATPVRIIARVDRK